MANGTRVSSNVVGIDTAHHVGEVLAAGYPDRMKFDQKSSLDVMYENKRFGQKNSLGYYSYSPDKKGRPKRAPDETVEQCSRQSLMEQPLKSPMRRSSTGL